MYLTIVNYAQFVKIATKITIFWSKENHKNLQIDGCARPIDEIFVHTGVLSYNIHCVDQCRADQKTVQLWFPLSAMNYYYVLYFVLKRRSGQDVKLMILSCVQIYWNILLSNTNTYTFEQCSPVENTTKSMGVSHLHSLISVIREI